jgi:hypothetical protein
VKGFYGNGTRRKGHPCPEVAVACGVITTAIKDMRGVEAKHIRTRIDATVWLASKGATLWFDASGVGQPYALTGMDWAAHARHLLDGEAGRMSYWNGDESLRSKAISPEQSELLRDGLDYFEGHRRVDGGTTAK